MTYQTSWSIADFRLLTETFAQDKSMESNQVAFKLPSVSEEAATITINCYPNVRPTMDDHQRVLMRSSLQFSSRESDWNFSMSIGLPNKDGVEEYQKKTTGIAIYDKDVSLRLDRQKVLNILQPDGSLVIIVKVTCVFVVTPVVFDKTGPIFDHQQMQEGQQLPGKESLSTTMLDNFVHLGAASVLLVFQDGEQLCHTFPLAARNGKQFFFSTFWLSFRKK
jgi:hypothetical protein